MDKSNLLTVFAIGVPITWALLVAFLAAAVAHRDKALAVTFVILGAVLAMYTLDAARAGVW